MSNCTGKRCPMQVGYDVANCNAKDCPFRTEPITNHDRIRNMSVEELAELIGDICKGLEVCCCPAEDFCQKNYTKLICKGCKDLIFKWLESEVTEE